jgi:hypothetical protein
MPGLNSLPRSIFGGIQVQGADMGANLWPVVQSTEKTIPTTGSVEWVFRCPCAGTLLSVNFVGKDSLAGSDTNFVQFSGVDKGTGGAGAPALLQTASGASSTKTTGGGNGYTGYARLILVPVAGVVVAAGETLVITATANGTLPNTITEGVVSLRFIPS